MTRWRTRQDLEHQVVTLSGQGVRRRAIARALGVSRNTVKKIVIAHDEARRVVHAALAAPPPRAPRPRKVDAFAARAAELLARYPTITAQRVFEELRAAGFDGGYTGVKEYVRKARPRPPVTPSLSPPPVGPGDVAESDWSPYRIDFTAAGRQTVQAFGYTLAYSRRKSFGVFARADLHALMDGHVAAFDRLVGVARVCKYDNQKPVVLGWEGHQPIYNPRFLAFATHYGFRPEACRPRHPNDKPHVERGFWEFERSFLCGRTFRDPGDLRQQLLHWERAVHDVRVHRSLRRTPLAMHAEEQPHLLPLPAHPYDTARVVYRVCSIDGFVAWDGNRYAVPYEHVTDLLPVRITQHELFVYAADLRCVARHALVPKGAGQDVVPAGMHEPARRRGAGLDQLRVAFEQMGPHAAEFFADLVAATGRWAGYQARQILLLRERYATADLDRALGHARAFGALDHHAVGRVLAARAAPRRLAEYVAEQSAGRWGEDPTSPRDLDEYDRLPLAGTASSHPQEPSCPSPASPTPTRSPTDSDDTSSGSD